MTGRILEISTNGLSLHSDRGFLSIRQRGETLAKVPIADIDSLIISAQGVMCSTKLISALVKNGATAVFVDEKFSPSMLLVPCDGHHAQAGRMRSQAKASRPLRKRIWAQIVRAKILAQAEALEQQGKSCSRLLRLARQVRSGDPDNREALAAQHYWPRIFEKKFKRDRRESGANAMLNYGYAVVRSAAARAIVSSGLHPSLSLHHVSNDDAYCLADDIMEPFRPAVDLTVLSLLRKNAGMDSAETRASLAGVLDFDYLTENGHTPMSVALVKLTQSLANVFDGKYQTITLPLSRLPITQSEA